MLLAAAMTGPIDPAGALDTAFNMELIDQLLLGPPETVTDVDIDGSLAFVGRGPLGLSIIDVSNPGHMQVVGGFNIPGQLVVNDVQAANGRAYITNESYNGVAVYILDVRNPAVPVVIGAIIQPLLNSAHNLFIDGDILYVIGHEGFNWRTYIFDVSDPAVPQLLADLNDVGAHDITVLDHILYEAGGWSGLHIYDVSDPAHPVHLAQADINDGPLPHFHTHSVWPTEDRRYILTLNEITNWQGPGQIQAGGLKVWEWDGASELTLVANWRPDVAIGSEILTIHNAVVRGRYAYISYYQAGIRVLDLQDPTAPAEVGFYDTYPLPPLALFEGCWGVDLGPGGDPIVYGSDRTNGLFQLSFNGSRRVEFAGEVINAINGASIAGASVRSLTADRLVRTDADGQFSMLTGEGHHRITAGAPGYIGIAFDVDLSAKGSSEPQVIKLFPDTAPSWAPARPAEIRLEPGHPNPFREMTAIPFDVGSSGEPEVRLTVYDSAGRTVRVLFDGFASPGRHAATWDGRDERGVLVSAGVYHLRLAAGGWERTGRLQLIH